MYAMVGEQGKDDLEVTGTLRMLLYECASWCCFC